MKAKTAERLPYVGGYPVFLSRYVITEGDKPCAVLRFANWSDIVITGIRFSFVQRNAKGEELSRQTLEYRDLFAECGTEFPVPDIAVLVGCAAVETAVEAVLSDNYEYVVEEGGVRLRYGGEKPREAEPSFLRGATYKARKKKKIYVLMSLVLALLLAALAFAVAWSAGALEGLDMGSEVSDLTQTEVSAATDHVEA